ncbi:hypothetical protein E2C01_024739 [Portunus trituberculatus]|uniref:Uncharacterized protein n=1 Tax=Portunus trituberculatus TaxID=210409 RepID=A0A5B7EB41_PORTR|nr:hypothetical protein [Portunus trituberculatus]
MDGGEERPSEVEGKWCRPGGGSTTEYRQQGHALEAHLPETKNGAGSELDEVCKPGLRAVRHAVWQWQTRATNTTTTNLGKPVEESIMLTSCRVCKRHEMPGSADRPFVNPRFASQDERREETKAQLGLVPPTRGK